MSSEEGQYKNELQIKGRSVQWQHRLQNKQKEKMCCMEDVVIFNSLPPSSRYVWATEEEER